MQTCSLQVMVEHVTGPTDARPLQVRIADDIRAQIETGQLPPGTGLPTLSELAEANLCSLAVVRKAVDLLKQQGLVVTAQGKGAFVRERPATRRHGMARYSRSVWKSGVPILTAEAESQGYKAAQELRELAEVPAPAEIAERLGIDPEAPVWVRRRTTLIGNRPNQLADSYYPLEVTEAAPRLRDENTCPGGGFARLEEAGYSLAEISEDLSARMPTGPESVALQLPTGTPVVDLCRVTYDITGQPVEVMSTVLAGDMAAFSYQFPIPD